MSEIPTYKTLKDIQLRLEYLANPKKPTIEVLVGISGSGKSTYAKELVNEEGEDWVRVCRDDIRTMLYGLSPRDHAKYYNCKDIRHKEKMVTAVEDSIIMAALHEGKNVVVDATHLKMEYINRHKKFGHPVMLAIFTTPFDVCVQRDFERDRNVGGDVIARQYSQLNNLLKQIL